MQKIKKLIAVLLSVAMLLGTFTMLNADSVYAKGKKTYYSGNFLGKVKDVDRTGIISKVKFTKTKMTITGSLKKGIVENQLGMGKQNIVKRKKELLN